MNDSSAFDEIDPDEGPYSFTRAAVSMVVTNPRMEDNPIVYVNDAFEQMTGYARSAIIGRNCRFLQGENTNEEQVGLLHDAVEDCEEVAVDILNYRANGEPFMNRLIVTPIYDEEGECAYFFGIQKELREVDRKRRDEEVQSQLMEIQHRVKNHLSMIIGMIRNQSRDATAPSEFSALARRIESLQLLYDEMSLDGESNRDSVNLSAYITRVANAVAHIDGRAGVRCSIDAEPLNAPVDMATRVGLILSEVMTNAFQHAFDGLDEGLVDVRMTALSGGGLRLSVSDDGVGLPADLDWPKQGSLGARIVHGLIEALDGSLIVSRGAAGTVVTIEVPAGAGDEDDA